ncbi:AMP-dependent synthetase/ligase [Streptomyces sp. NPDC046805]|uniref:AMP-dependent synthetase/ligase n=1 Tax=Streptomyces sp. NPDC046805 TaxID=3155134 RepID=UPI0033E66D8B
MTDSDSTTPTTLCAAFQATAARHPEAVALRTPGNAVTVTWAEYADRVRDTAAALAALGVRRGDTLALMMTNRPEFHFLDTAAHHLGAAPFSVYNTAAPQQIAHVLRDAGCRIAVCEEQFAALLTEACADTQVERVLCVDGKPDGTLPLDEVVADPDFDFDAAWQAVHPDDLLTLIYTSGTTGEPKGVELTHGRMLFTVEAANQVIEAGVDDRIVSFLPAAHVADRFASHYLPSVHGTQVTCLADARQLPSVLPEVRPTVLGAPPGFWRKIMEALTSYAPQEPDSRRLSAAAGLDAVRFAFAGAAPISDEILDFFHRLGVPLGDVWGMSEIGAPGVMQPSGAHRRGTAGKPLPGLEVTLAEDGELLIRGGSVMRGYHNKPELTAEALDADGWLHTGDLAEVDDDGYVRIVGRKKELIINDRGKNMSPTVIEDTVLACCPLAEHAVVIGDGRKYVVALIALSPPVAEDFAKQHGLPADPAVLAADPRLRAALEEGVAQANAKLSRVEQVKKFAVLPEYWTPGSDVLTPTLKVRRAPIARRYADRIEALYADDRSIGAVG